MRKLLIAPAAVVAAGCLAPAGAIAHGVATRKPNWYLALGDSLSRGAQPNASGATVPTNQGYANDIYAAQKAKLKHLAFKDLGCLGETTTTMIKGGICKYALGSQLKAATHFLNEHKGHVALITIDIGANDIDNCLTSAGVDFTCVANGEAAIQKNLPKIAAALRNAAGKTVPIVGMNYYDPFLADWFQGPNGQALAFESQQLARQVNKDIAGAYSSRGVEVATVAHTFKTYVPLSKTETFHGQQVPVAVVEVCKLTWMCAAAPEGPNIHANAAGYREIAAAFEEKRL